MYSSLYKIKSEMTIRNATLDLFNTLIIKDVHKISFNVYHLYKQG